MRHRNLDSKIKQLLQQRAQLMRACPCAPEQALWLAIRLGQLGTPFRRQYPIGRFVADFAAPQARLVVEVDGPCHEQRRAADARRDRKLARLGYRVLRLEAELVIKQLPAAMARVREALANPDHDDLAATRSKERPRAPMPHAVPSHRTPPRDALILGAWQLARSRRELPVRRAPPSLVSSQHPR